MSSGIIRTDKVATKPLHIHEEHSRNDDHSTDSPGYKLTVFGEDQRMHDQKKQHRLGSTNQHILGRMDTNVHA